MDLQDGCTVTKKARSPGAIVHSPGHQSTPDHEKPPENECETCFISEERSDYHSQGSEGGAGAICPDNKLWDKTVLKVWFLNPIPQSWTYSGHKYPVPGAQPGHIIDQRDILRLANLWNTRLPPSISKEKREKVPTFVEATDPMDSDIRIWFTTQGGCRTNVGTHACSVPKGNQESNKTMTLNLTGKDSYKEHLVIHEFGHALGLGHEHQRAVFWQNVGKFLRPGVVQKCFNMSDKEFAIDVASYGNIPGQESAEYDADSIMHYWFDPSWLQPQFDTEAKVDALPNTSITNKERKCLKSLIRRKGKLAEELSQTDKEFIADVYYKKLSSTPSGSGASPPAVDDVSQKTIISEERSGGLGSKRKGSPDSEGVFSKIIRRRTRSKQCAESNSEVLLAGCRNKDADIQDIKSHLKKSDCDINFTGKDKFKWTSLMWACDNKRFDIAKLILEHKPLVNIWDKKHWTPLVLASRAGNLEIVQGIVKLHEEEGELEKFIDEPTNKGWTPLMWAAHEGNTDVAEFLINKGANVMSLDENRWTPLMQASQEGHLDVVDKLLEHKCKADMINYRTGSCWCALMAAAKNKHSDVVERLLSDDQMEANLTRDGSSALHVASYYNDNDNVIEALITIGEVEVNKRNKEKMTPLMIAASRGNLEAVRTLLKHGAKTDFEETHTSAKESTALFIAAEKGFKEIVEELLEHKAKTELETSNGETLRVIDVAYGKGHKEIVSMLKDKLGQINHEMEYTNHYMDGNIGLIKVLLKNGADTEEGNKKNWTPLMIATNRKKRLEVVKTLVNGGAKVEHQKPDGMSALHIGAVKGHTEYLDVMTDPVPGSEHKVNLEIKDKWGMTPLMLATKNGHTKAAKVLMDKGANVNTKSERYAGWSPLHFAIKGGYMEIVKLLLGKNANMRTKDQNNQTPLAYAFTQKRDIYTSVIDFLEGKPQVVRAIKSAEDTSVPRLPTSPREETLSGSQPDVAAVGDEPAAPSIPQSPEANVSIETENVLTTNYLKQLQREAESSVSSRGTALNIKDLERSYQRDMTIAMQSGTPAAAGAA